MASNATPARREGLLRAVRKVIVGNHEIFAKAGKRLGEIYSEKHLKQHDHEGKWDDKTSDELVFPRLDCARLGVIYDDYPTGYTDMRFEEPMPQAERKLAASMVLLTLVLAIDPDANEYVSESMCPFAALPWYFGEEVPGLLGRCMFGWVPGENNSVNSPPGEVLDLLERAKWSASNGDVMPVGMTIPTGDGQPCNEPGTNQYDELRRALDDVCRHVGAFKGNAEAWSDVTEFECGDELSTKKQEILDDNRTWWASWESAMRRARDASLSINRPELKKYIDASLGGLGSLASIFHAPLMGTRGEVMGDHLLKRGALRCDRKGLTSYPQETVMAAYQPIRELIERLILYVDGTIVEKTEGIDRLVPEPQSTNQDADFRSISSFPTEMHSRIRQATLPTRKTKRVRKRNPSGQQVEYSYADALDWWPRDLVDDNSAPR